MKGNESNTDWEARGESFVAFKRNTKGTKGIQRAKRAGGFGRLFTQNAKDKERNTAREARRKTLGVFYSEYKGKL